MAIWAWGSPPARALKRGTQAQDRSKLVLITNTKSYMSFRLVPKSVTLNKRVNGVMAVTVRYFTEFGNTA